MFYSALCAGNHNEKRESYGHSLVIDPWGTIIGELDARATGIALVELDMDKLEEVRRNMPIAQHRELGDNRQQVPTQ